MILIFAPALSQNNTALTKMTLQTLDSKVLLPFYVWCLCAWLGLDECICNCHFYLNMQATFIFWMIDSSIMQVLLFLKSNWNYQVSLSYDFDQFCSMISLSYLSICFLQCAKNFHTTEKFPMLNAFFSGFCMKILICKKCYL